MKILEWGKQPSATPEQIQEFAESLRPKYGQLIFTTAYNLLYNKDKSDDVTQETLLKLIALSDRLCFLEQKALKVYIYKAAYRNTLTYIKKNPEMLSWDTIAKSHIFDINRNIVANTVENKEIQELLIECINLLPDRQRDLIILKYFQDLDNKAIAEVLGISTGAVRILKNRALARLRKLLRDKGVDYYE